MTDLIMTAGPGLLALAWLALREMAPRTKTKLDDNLVSFIENTVEKAGEKTREREESAGPPTTS